MPLPKFLRRKHHNPRIHGESDKLATKAFVLNRSWFANQWLLLVTPLVVLGFGLISYAAFAATLNAPAGYIDNPAPNADIYNTAYTISGWAVAATYVNHVEIYIDGIDRGTASYGTGSPRPDVCAIYPQSPNCANNAMVGWQFTIDSHGYSIGGHSVVASIYGSGGGHTDTAARPFYIDNPHLPPTGYIDTPAPGATVSSTVNVGGWALDGADRPETPISRISMSIDAYPFTYTPIYGADRPDVCAVYPGRPGCNAVGFNYSWDTTQIPNGAHTIHVTAYDSDGHSVTLDRNVTISNAGPPPVVTGPGTTPGTNPGGGLPPGSSVYPDGYVDDPKPAPKSPNPYSGQYMTIDGWAVDLDSVVSRVSIIIDGSFVGNANYGNTGVPRPDVCASHAGWVNCPPGNIGWQMNYDTTRLTNGSHKVHAVINDGKYPVNTFTTQDITFTTNNSSSSPPNGTGLPPVVPPTTTNLPPDLFIDNINDPGTTATSANGWAIDNITKAESAIAKVTVYVDGSLAGTARYGGARSDVCAAYPGRAGCPNVGWNIVFDTSNLLDGSLHMLNVTATDSTGLSRTAGQPFVVNNGGVDGGGGDGGAAEGGASKCSGRATADRDPNSTPQIHYIYAIPANATAVEDRCMDTGAAIQRSVATQNSWLANQPTSGGKTLSVDRIAGSSKPDVTFVRLNQTKAWYTDINARGQTGAFEEIISEVHNHFQNPNKRYIVYFDGDLASSGACGMASVGFSSTVPQPGANTDRILYAVGVVPLRNVVGNSCSSGSLGGGGMGPGDIKILHETLHALGAVPSCGAHSGLGAHVTDSNDIMYGRALQISNIPSIKLDVGGDSYFGGSVNATCFNIRTDSKFVQ